MGLRVEEVKSLGWDKLSGSDVSTAQNIVQRPSEMDCSGYGSSENGAKWMKMNQEAICGRTLMCAVCSNCTSHFLQNWPQLANNLAKTLETYWTTIAEKLLCCYNQKIVLLMVCESQKPICYPPLRE